MKNIDVNATIERIKFLRKQYSGQRGKSKFAKALGISPSTYSYYENNRIPPIDMLLNICNVTGADLNWLLTGQKAGEGPQNQEKQVQDRKMTEDVEIEGSLMRKLNALLCSDPDKADAILAFIELLMEKKRIEADLSSTSKQEQIPTEHIPASRPERPGWIPILGRTAAGMVHFWDQAVLPKPKQAVTELDQLVKRYTGKKIVASVYGTISVDLRAQALINSLRAKQVNLIQVCEQQGLQGVEFIQCEQIHKLFPDSFALQIDGDSMSPRINDGNIVILSPSVPAAEGHIAVARLANQIGVTCKLKIMGYYFGVVVL